MHGLGVAGMAYLVCLPRSLWWALVSWCPQASNYFTPADALAFLLLMMISLDLAIPTNPRTTFPIPLVLRAASASSLIAFYMTFLASRWFDWMVHQLDDTRLLHHDSSCYGYKCYYSLGSLTLHDTYYAVGPFLISSLAIGIHCQCILY